MGIKVTIEAKTAVELRAEVAELMRAIDGSSAVAEIKAEVKTEEKVTAARVEEAVQVEKRRAADKAPAEEEAPAKEEAPAEEEAPAKEEAPIVTLEMVREKLSQLVQAGYRDEVKDLLSDFGAARLVEVKESDYAALLEKAKGLGE